MERKPKVCQLVDVDAVMIYLGVLFLCVCVCVCVVCAYLPLEALGIEARPAIAGVLPRPRKYIEARPSAR
jgi:hypothetical protein